MNYANDTELADIICDYINTCFNLRKHYFEPFEDMNNQSIEPTCTRAGRLTRPRYRLIETIE